VAPFRSKASWHRRSSRDRGFWCLGINFDPVRWRGAPPDRGQGRRGRSQLARFPCRCRPRRARSAALPRQHQVGSMAQSSPRCQPGGRLDRSQKGVVGRPALDRVRRAQSTFLDSPSRANSSRLRLGPARHPAIARRRTRHSRSVAHVLKSPAPGTTKLLPAPAIHARGIEAFSQPEPSL